MYSYWIILLSEKRMSIPLQKIFPDMLAAMKIIENSLKSSQRQKAVNSMHLKWKCEQKKGEERFNGTYINFS